MKAPPREALEKIAKALRPTPRAPYWVVISEDFGERLWGDVLAKGSRPTNDNGAEVLQLPWWAALKFDPASLLKARTARYIKRVPTGNPKRPWRYYYKIQHGGGVHNQEHFKEGASFAHGDGGHYQIHDVKDGKLVVSHSSMPEQRTEMTHAELASRLAGHHKAALDAYHTKLEREHKDALEVGNAKGAERIRTEAAKTGHTIAEPARAMSAGQYRSLIDSVGQWRSSLSGAVGKDEREREGEALKRALAKLKGATLGRAHPELPGQAQRMIEGAEAQLERSAAIVDKPKKPAAGAEEPLDFSGGGKGLTPEQVAAKESSKKNEATAKIPRERVEHSLDQSSSNISGIRWTPNGAGKAADGKADNPEGKGTMRVRFKGGDTYDYHDVHHGNYDAVRTGKVDGSPGKSLNTLVRGQHESEKIMEGTRGTAPINTETEAERAKKERVKARAEADAKEKAPSAEKEPDLAPALEESVKRAEAAKEPVQPPADTAPPPDHLAEASKVYALSDKDVDHIKRSGLHQKALEHAAAGDHEKAKSHVRLAVKEHFTRDRVRNMSASGAERFMKEKERAAGLKKALASVGQSLKKSAA